MAAVVLPALAACGGGGTHVVEPATRHLVYVTGDDPAHATVWLANVDGSHGRRVGPGSAAALSPDGLSVAVLRKNGIYLLSADGSRVHRLTSERLRPQAWSPDGTTLFATRAAPLSVLELDAVDKASGKVRVVASGSVYGFSFSPDGGKLVYSKAPVATGRGLCGDQFDLYATKVSGGTSTRLTHDGVSAFPVWGPAGIAYLRIPDDIDPEAACAAPGIWTMKDDGSDAKPVIARAPLLLSQDGLYGLEPLAWLDDSHILAGIRTDSGTLGTVLNVQTRKLHAIRDFADTVSSDGRYSVGSGGDGQTVHLSIVRLSDRHRIFRTVDACCPSWNR
jgi:Tol biopolymer transport system component